MPNYRIYPSLLDKFASLQDYEQEAEQPWNIVSENAHKQGRHLDKEIGDYVLSPDEMYTKIEAELIDTINRCDGIVIEAADKGTCFNEVVDCLAKHRACDREDIKIHSEQISETEKAIIAEMNGFSFAFDARFCQEYAKEFVGAIQQYCCKATIDTSFGDVELYGFIDEFLPNRIVDIKTTSQYTFGKFEQKWQRYVYPYCVIEEGVATEIEEFEYSVIVWKKTMPLTGEHYREVYTYNHDKAREKIRQGVEHFLHWLNSRRHLITDQRIFGGVNPEGYKGKPIDINKLKQ